MESFRFSLAALSLSPPLVALLSEMMKVSQEEDRGMVVEPAVIVAMEPVMMMVSDAE